jgi:hypothetical protein
MAGGKSVNHSNEVLDAYFGSGRPATWYVALYTVSPTAAGGGTEAAYGSYARVAVTNNGTNFPAAASGRKSNGAAITFPTPSSGSGTIVAFGILTASSGGTLKRFGPVSPNLSIVVGTAISFAIGALLITES